MHTHSLRGPLNVQRFGAGATSKVPSSAAPWPLWPLGPSRPVSTPHLCPSRVWLPGSSHCLSHTSLCFLGTQRFYRDSPSSLGGNARARPYVAELSELCPRQACAVHLWDSGHCSPTLEPWPLDPRQKLYLPLIPEDAGPKEGHPATWGPRQSGYLGSQPQQGKDSLDFPLAPPWPHTSPHIQVVPLLLSPEPR
jgi:hypothetical protein